MKRKTRASASRTYTYGAMIIDDGKLLRGGCKRLPEALHHELWQAHMYRNKRVELVHRGAEMYAEIRAKHSPECEHWEQRKRAADQAYLQLVEFGSEVQRAHMARQIEAAKAAGKKPPGRVKRIKHAELDAWLAVLKPIRREAAAKLKEARELYDAPRERVDQWWKALSKFRADEMGAKEGDNYGKARANAVATEEMMRSPDVPEFWKELQRRKEQLADEAKLARAWIDIQSGTKGLVEKATEPKRDVFLQFRPFANDGRVGAHFSRGVTWEQLQERTTGFRLRRVTEGKPHSGKRRASVVPYDCWVPLGPGNRDYALFRVVVDRPLPAGARIKDAWLLARRRGVKTTFEVQFSIEVNAASPGIVRERGERGMAAFHLAYRQDGDSIRAGYLDADVPIIMHGEDIRGPVRVPEKALAEMEMAHELRSRSDAIWEAVRERVIEWVQNDAPSEVRERCRTIAHWRNPMKVAEILSPRPGTEAWRLWPTWLQQRLPKMPAEIREMQTGKWRSWCDYRHENGIGADLFGNIQQIETWAREHGAVDPRLIALQWWARKHLHLADTAERLRTRAHRHRDDYYRNVVAATRRSVASVVVDDQQLREAKRARRNEQPAQLPDGARSQLQQASPGRLRELFDEVFGPDYTKKSIAGLPWRCHVCGADVGTSKGVTVQCKKGHAFDRDRNVTQQMLTREWLGDAETTGGARKEKTGSSLAAE